jgi:hypothetical protein
MINKLDNLDNKVNEIQKSIRIFKAMINERIGSEEFIENQYNEDDNE